MEPLQLTVAWLLFVLVVAELARALGVVGDWLERRRVRRVIQLRDLEVKAQRWPEGYSS